MRSWLNDKRAYAIMRHWLKTNPHKEPGYDLVENFRPWVFQTTGHFFDVTQIWNDQDILKCCVRLRIEPPPLILPPSYSEDEFICKGSKDAKSQPQATGFEQGSLPVEGGF